MESKSITQGNKEIPLFLQIEMINMHFDKGLSVGQIRRQYLYPLDQIARVLVMANIETERTIILDSKMNYTKKL